MKHFFAAHGKTLALSSVVLVLVLLLGYVALQAGPLAPVPVTVETVQVKALQPALFGIGTVEARVTHKIGPTVAGRVKRVDVQTGDAVKAVADQLVMGRAPVVQRRSAPPLWMGLRQVVCVTRLANGLNDCHWNFAARMCVGKQT